MALNNYADLRAGERPAPEKIPPGLKSYAIPGTIVKVMLEDLCAAPMKSTLQETLGFVGEITYNVNNGTTDDENWVSFAWKLTEIDEMCEDGVRVIMRTKADEWKSWTSHGKG